MCAHAHAGGLAATASVNIAFGLSSSYPLLLALWGLNGLLQVPPPRPCKPSSLRLQTTSHPCPCQFLPSMHAGLGVKRRCWRA